MCLCTRAAEVIQFVVSTRVGKATGMLCARLTEYLNHNNTSYSSTVIYWMNVYDQKIRTISSHNHGFHSKLLSCVRCIHLFLDNTALTNKNLYIMIMCTCVYVCYCFAPLPVIMLTRSRKRQIDSDSTKPQDPAAESQSQSQSQGWAGLMK